MVAVTHFDKNRPSHTNRQTAGLALPLCEAYGPSCMLLRAVYFKRTSNGEVLVLHDVRHTQLCISKLCNAESEALHDTQNLSVHVT